MLDTTENTPTGQDKAGNTLDLTNYISQLPEGFAPPADFLSALGHDPRTAYVAGFRSQAAGNWKGAFGLASLAHLDPKQGDFYFSQARLRPEATGRHADAVVAHVCLCVDDIGTEKGDRARWEAAFAAGCPHPTARLQTSPGSEQWFWRLEVPILPGTPEEQDLQHLRGLLGAHGLSDPKVVAAVQYLRIPLGWNSKEAHIKANNGTPPPVQLLELVPGRQATVEGIGVALFGSDWREQPLSAGNAKTATRAADAGGRAADLSRRAPFLRLAEMVGLNPVQGPPGVVHATCPNAKAHTQDGREGTGFAFISDDACKCQHASCQNLHSGDFRAMMLALMDEQEGREGAGRAWWLQANLEFVGAFNDAQEVMHTANVMAANQAATLAQAVAHTSAVILGATFAPVAPIATHLIPPRRWLYGRSVIAGFLSFLVAPGGAGKSSLAMARGVAMASGRELLSGEKPVRPLRVWVHNAEDDQGEMQRRLAAVLQHFGMTHADLNDNLFMTSGRDMKLQLARTGRDGPEIVPGVVDALVEKLVSARIDVLILDPLGALHTLPENSNEAANLLSGALREVAHRADVAVVVLHHTGKAAAMDMDAAGAGASRGASAFVDAARVVEQVVRMTEKEAGRFGIADTDRRDYLRVENGKANLARAESGRWLRLVDVPLGNGAGLWPLGDRVGVVERWTPSETTGTATDLARVQAAIGAAQTPPRYSPKAEDWVGYVVAQALNLNIGPVGAAQKDRTAEEAAAHARVRALLDGWFRDGGLLRLKGRDPRTRHEVDLVGIGKPAILSDERAAFAAAGVDEKDAEDAPGDN